MCVCVCVFFFFLDAAARGGTCAFTLKIVSTLIKNSSRDDRPSISTINPRPTRFVSSKANECRWRPRRYQVDPWSRRRDVARGVLCSSPKPEKRSIFGHRRGIKIFLSSVFYTPVDKCFCIRHLAGARHVSPAVL